MKGARSPIQPREVVIPLFRRRGSSVHLREKAAGAAPPARRPARIAYMLALALQVEKMIERGELKGRAHAAANLGFTRARLTQLLSLTLLAPDIQEELLFLEVDDGVERTTERVLRDIMTVDDWGEQRRRWRMLRAAPLKP